MAVPKAAMRFMLIFLVLLGAPFLRAQEIDKEGAQENQEGFDPNQIDRQLEQELLLHPELVDPAVLVRVYQPALRHWPRAKKGLDAAGQILKGGKETIPYLLKLLDDRDYRLKPAVAYLLGELGCVEAWERIDELLDQPRLKSESRYLLQALTRLDADRATDRAVELLASGDSVRRQAAFSLFQDHGLPKDPALFKDFLASPEGDIRYKTFLLLKKRPPSWLDAAALGLVGDEYPKLAQEITDYLAARNTPEVAQGLKERLTFEFDRGFAFAAAAAAKLENRFALVLFAPEDASKLEPYLNSRDPLFRVIAAAGLGNLYHRAGSEADWNRIRTRIIPIFMDVFLKNRYFKDHACMLELASESLTRLTERSFDKDLTAWRTWWEEEGKRFASSRILISLDATQYGRTQVFLNRPENTQAPKIRVAGEEMFEFIERTAGDRIVFLEAQDLGALAESLYNRGFFERRSLEDQEKTEPTQPNLEMRFEERSRRIAPDGANDQGFAAMQASVLETFQENLWQMLYTQGDAKKWWENRYSWWKEQDAQARTERFTEDLVLGLPDLPDAIALESIAWLKKREGLAARLTFDRAVALLSDIEERRPILDPVISALADLLTATKNPDLLEPMVVYLYGSYAEASLPFLARALEDFGLLDQAFTDGRWFLRAAAAQAASQAPGDRTGALLALLQDERPEVRFAAIRALARKGGDEADEPLRSILTGPDQGARLVLAESLAESPPHRALNLYRIALKTKDRELWKIALDGLSSLKNAETARLIFDFMNEDLMAGPEPDLEAARWVLDSLVRMGGEAGRVVLLKLLPLYERIGMGSKAVLSLASLGETRVFPRLQDLMIDGSLRARALDSMAFLLVSDFGEEVWKYRELWEKYPAESQAFFLKRALGPAESDPGGGLRFEDIPVARLLAALENPSWPIRLAALRILEDYGGEHFGGLAPDTPGDEAAKVVEAWRLWYSRRR